MSRLLSPIHRIATRSTTSGGIRWSSYVGDVRCWDNLSKSYSRRGFASFSANLSTNTNPVTNHNRRSFRSNNNNIRSHERLLVLGSGVAGCATALTAARHGIPVTVLHAGSLKEDCNSYWAQGGIIYKNYRLWEGANGGMMSDRGGNGETKRLVDTTLSLVEDIRVASGYLGKLQRGEELEEGRYGDGLVLNNKNSGSNSNGSRNVLGKKCSTTGIHWNEDAAWKLACEGPSRVRELLLGKRDGGMNHDGDLSEGVTSTGCVVPFDRVKDGNLDVDVLSLCLEASHAAPRIIHHADCTGKVITTHITKAAANHPLIEFVGDSLATDLLFDSGNSSTSSNDGLVIGARVLDKRSKQLTNYYATHGVVLASGGLAGIYQHSTNPVGFNALGSSVGLALRLENDMLGRNKGGIVSDLEYIQFHPTSLYVPNEARFLLTEALRGEGAILRDADGRAFARDYHPNGELAPRDIVARAVFSETQKTSGEEHNAFLDITHRDSDWLKGRFPSIHAHLTSRDKPMDFTKECIPVIPAAHYTCGGVTTDLDGRVVGSKEGRWYRNLFAAGEAARTGLHGGNRLASTSLLEGLVFGSSVGEMVAGAGMSNYVGEEVNGAVHEARSAIEQRLARERSPTSKSASGVSNDTTASREANAFLTQLKALMWDNVGVVRDPAKLSMAVSELTAIRDQADLLWEENSECNKAGEEIVALRDAAYAGLALAKSALANRVSGGAHYVAPQEDANESLSDGESSSDEEEEEVMVAVARG
ncbi:hypothetical protein HJC23_013666 [Cyclotella cryptica]|uniref:L-aspartate oxidase n=1 Tax=Cyclotella cryptica TaxID=29204 RepID=A0ABD3QUE6_9STRA|eukprot:CCRYP_001498-RA/>CCRYP_001498-RA protein AED:0.02 eAED:0.02 QI:361/1/1/1/0.5/0.33/3/189/759